MGSFFYLEELVAGLEVLERLGEEFVVVDELEELVVSLGATFDDAGECARVSLEVEIDLVLAVVLLETLELVEEGQVLFGVLLRAFGDHEHELKVISTKSDVEELVDVDNVEQVSQTFINSRCILA